MAPSSRLSAGNKGLLRGSTMWRRRIDAALSLGGQMRSFDATHCLALLFPMAGMVPAIVAACQVYTTSVEYRNNTEADVMLRFTPISIYPEPFACLSNIAYLGSGLALFLLPLLSGSFLAPHAFGSVSYTHLTLPTICSV